MAFNPLHVPEDQRIGFVSDFLSYLANFFKTEMHNTPRMQNLIAASIDTLIHSKTHWPLVTLYGLLTNERVRNDVIASCTDDDTKAFWKIEFPKLEREGAVQPILNKIRPLLASTGHLHAILAARETRLDFADILNNKRILLVRLSKDMEDASNFLASLIITRLQREAMTRHTIPKEEREAKTFFLYLDEFQNYWVDSVKSILSEAPKYGLWLRLANQTLHTISPNIRQVVPGLMGPIVSFRIGADEAALIQKEMRRVIDKANPSAYRVGQVYHTQQFFPTPEDFLNQDRFQAFIRLDKPADVVQAMTEELPPPLLNDAGVRRIKELSEEKYYRDAKPGKTKPPEDKRKDFME